MTNLDRIKSFTAKELAEWLDTNSNWDNNVWIKWWDENYCEKCPPIKCKLKDTGEDIECAYCELEKHCKFFPEMSDTPDCTEIIEKWLNVEVKDTNGER